MRNPRILQLCFINNLWPSDFDVVSIDVKSGSDVLELPIDYGCDFDYIVAAPPCDQFTKANSLNWIESPDYFIAVANKCFLICKTSGKPWLMENPPGRITKFIPALQCYRVATWSGSVTNKEYVVYSNHLFTFPRSPRYGKPGTINNYSKSRREEWQSDFFNSVYINALACLEHVGLLGLSYASRTQIVSHAKT